MNESLFRSAGLVGGILVGLIIVVLLMRFSNRNGKYKSEYDERQKFIRGDAYRFAFYSLMICEVIGGVLEMSGLSLPFESYVLHFGSIFVGCTVLASYCIWKDAYWGLNNNRKRYAAIFLVCGLLNALPLVMQLTKGADNDPFSFPYISLMACVMLLLIGAEILIKHFLTQREERED